MPALALSDLDFPSVTRKASGDRWPISNDLSLRFAKIAKWVRTEFKLIFSPFGPGFSLDDEILSRLVTDFERYFVKV